MGRSRIALATLGVLLFGAAVSSQQRPNFSGRWVMVSPSEGAGEEQVVKHDDALLSTEHRSEGGTHRIVYKLDGSESRNVVTVHEQEIVTASKASWNGNQIIITSATTYPDGSRVDQKEVWSLDAQGRLIIDFTRTSAGQPPTTVKLVHTKR